MKFEDNFPFKQEGNNYLNTCGLGIPPRQVLDDLSNNYLSIAKNPHIEYEYEQQIKIYHEIIRRRIGQSNENFSFLRNVTEGLSIISRAIPLEKNSEILLTSLEHRSAINCWYLRQVNNPQLNLKIKICEIHSEVTGEEILDIISQQITDRTRVLSIPHIDRYYGILFPVKSICRIARELDITTVIDGAQTLGLVDINIDDLDCDIYVSCLHKWFLSPMSIGTISIHTEIFSSLLRSFASSNRWDDEPIERRQIGGQELGTRNVAIEKSVGSLLNFHDEWDDYIYNPSHTQKSLLFDCLSSIKEVNIIPVIDLLGPYGIITFYVKDVDSKLIISKLEKEHRIYVGISSRNGKDMVRVSVFFYNTRQDIIEFSKTLQLIIWKVRAGG